METNQTTSVPEDPESEEWDAIVIGTGMGGATAGFELARLGRRVLFLEKGRFVQRDANTVQGDLADPSQEPEMRLRRGYWPRMIQGRTSVSTDARRSRWSPIKGKVGAGVGDVDFFAPLGCGTGGSTILYGATLERFHPKDFTPRANYPDVTDSTLPPTWPVGWDEFEPFYQRAEQLYRVHGTPDPLHPDDEGSLPLPPPMNEQDQNVNELFLRRGLHPYRSHIGCEFKPGCDGCGGKVCLRACKSDSGRVCLVPAVDELNAHLMTECEVTRLVASDTAVDEVHCHWQGRDLRLRAKMVLVAAGALMSPILLLNSKGDAWPNGLANGSGLVGRNLMVHAGDMIAVRPGKRGDATGFNKSLSINDFYFHEGQKLGNFQSVGVPIDSGSVFAHVRSTLDKAPNWVSRMVPLIAMKVAARIGALLFRNAVVFGSILEDLPYHRNRVFPDPEADSGMRFEYEYPDELRERSALFRKIVASRLGRTRVVALSRPMNLNFGHPCGTCRFGDDPETSVLDSSNRAHEVDNLYVVDASFFPSSGGVNPSLTIAANALRVAGIIHERMGDSPRARS